MARHFLCSNGFNLRNLILEVTSECNPSLILEVMINSLLLEDEEICHSVVQPISTNISEEEEIRRLQDDMEKFATVLIDKSEGYGLDDDLL